VTAHLRVNPILCDGHGLCAELFPERVTLDDWGYPIIDTRPVAPELEEHARRAVDACPTLALALIRARRDRRASAEGATSDAARRASPDRAAAPPRRRR
jgi:ferredoxin